MVDKVREATAKQGNPKDPKVALLEIETVPEDQASARTPARGELLGLPADEVPPLRITWCHLRQDATGELIGQLPQDAR